VLFALPSLLFIFGLFMIPLAMTLWMSTNDWPLLGEPEFTGFENYRTMVDDERFRAAFWFTTKFTVISTVLTYLVGFGLALLVRGGLRWASLFRTAFFLPVVIGWAVASYIWVWLFNSQVGVINPVLSSVGLIDEPIGWLSDPNTALAALVTMTVWKSAGFAMLIFLVGLQAVPDELYEAAKIDGAGRLASLRYITVPLLRSTFVLVLIFLVTAFYLGFDQFYIMTRGGPSNSTITMVYWIFTNAFVGFRLGYGAALAVVLLVLLVVINGAQFLAAWRDPTR
jgi:multiple sugar transport system permease protein